ncbi:IS3 family transposase [Streptococcus canis]|nr:IS3 family transposase [Streptococcus canis]QKG77302.1 IS3 family transposase [Streptococcus canis]
MKSELFYGFKKAFAFLEVLETAISEDINYYHHNRIKLTLKGLRPVHRTQSLA